MCLPTFTLLFGFPMASAMRLMLSFTRERIRSSAPRPAGAPRAATSAAPSADAYGATGDTPRERTPSLTSAWACLPCGSSGEASCSSCSSCSSSCSSSCTSSSRSSDELTQESYLVTASFTGASVPALPRAVPPRRGEYDDVELREESDCCPPPKSSTVRGDGSAPYLDEPLSRFDISLSRGCAWYARALSLVAYRPPRFVSSLSPSAAGS